MDAETTKAVIKAVCTAAAGVAVALIKRKRSNGHESTEEWLRKQLDTERLATRVAEGRLFQEKQDRAREKLDYEKKLIAHREHERFLVEANEELEARLRELERGHGS